MYLDSVYVHRKDTEQRVIEEVREYLSTKDERCGKWVSIVGDAGHGKTSLLWCVAQECHHLGIRLYPVQALQLAPNALAEYVEWLTVGNHPYVFVLDTLDLLVGVDDQSLGGVLNALRANGGLVITTCRKQEIQVLASKVHIDQTVNLDRYSTDEARAAIGRYVNAFYVGWPEWRRLAQINHVWNLLDAQRKIQDLSFEPLVLRMIFEAYAPEEIPPDINTQKVYDHFWEQRVLGDRVAKGPEEAYARAALCLRLASYLYFETDAHTERASVSTFVEHYAHGEMKDTLSTLHGLVSSGVLRWWQMKASVGFFHQTFLEYAAAKSLLESDDQPARDHHIERLIEALERADMFRVPVLKQLLIQSSGENAGLFESLCDAVAKVDTAIAAGLLLEVLGKASNVAGLHQRVLVWNVRQPRLIRNVAAEVLRHFPAKRVDLALEILYPHMIGKAIGDIYNICATYFAPMAPESTLRFLLESWRSMPKTSRDFEAPLKTALSAAFKAGNVEVLDAMVEILPHLTVGVQAGALVDLSTLWTKGTAQHAALFLEKMFPILIVPEPNEPRHAYTRAFAALHVLVPDIARSLARRLRTSAGESPERKSSMLLARLIGIADPEPSVIDNAFDDLLGADHMRRIAASYLLREAARKNHEVMDRLLSLPRDAQNLPETVNVISTVASGSQDAEKVLALIERWDPTERGGGSAYRLLMDTAAKTDPQRTLAWLRSRIAIANTDARRRQILVGFQVVAENAPESIPVDDAKLFWQFGYLGGNATDEMKRVIAGVAGWISQIDELLARGMFLRVFEDRRRESINAAISSLRSMGSPEFVVFVYGLVRRFTNRQEHHATLGHFLEVISERDFDVRAALLQEIALPDSRVLLQELDSPVVVSNVLTLLKSTAKADAALVLDLAALCPLIDDGNLGTLSAVLDNASRQTDDPTLARAILARLLTLSSTQSFRIRSSLRSALPRLDRLLPHREVADAVLKTILASQGWPEKAQEQLVRAAKSMGSWSRADTEIVLRSELPHLVKATLLN